MRLIDADALIEDLKGSLFYSDSIPFVEEAPTAYDVEKVVAELKEKKDEAGIIAGVRSTRVDEDEYEEEPYHEGKKHAYGHAIELVKRGGVK